MLRLILSILSIICEPMRPLLLLTLLLNWSVAFGQEKVLALPGKLPTAQLSLQPNIPNTPSVHRIQMPKRAQPTRPMLVFFSAALGAVLFMSLFTVTQFLLNRVASYGWYAVYLSIVSAWMWQSTRIWFEGTSAPDNMTVFFAYVMLLGYGMMVSYIQFVSHLLEVPKQSRLERWTRYFLRFAGLSVLILLAELFIWNSIYVYILVNCLNYGGLVFLMVTMLRKPHPLKGYALAGSLFLVSGAIIAAFMNYMGPETTNQLAQMPLFYLVVCQLLEILCFSLALGRRFQLNKEEKIQAQQQLIQQLEENGLLQQSHAIDLKTQLTERTLEVEAKRYVIERQRIRQLETEFEQKLADTEMTALRAQMNPHFIFNCLNSIKLYTLDNEADKASDYLTKFSRLIRLVLENSRSELVPLQSELESLQLYSDLEAMRFKQKLQFKIRVEPGIDQRFIRIPPLLLQPYVENAIWHGLMHKHEGGTVTVKVSQPKDNLLHIEITDDGVGRERAAELKSKSAGKHKSFGMQVTADRIRMINQLYNIQTQAQVVDLVDSYGEAYGTRVSLTIPV